MEVVCSIVVELPRSTWAWRSSCLSSLHSVAEEGGLCWVQVGVRARGAVQLLRAQVGRVALQLLRAVTGGSCLLVFMWQSGGALYSG